VKNAKYIGAIDQGTTSTRFIVFDRAGRVVVQAQQKSTPRFIPSRDGWSMTREEIWQRTQQVIYEAMARGALLPTDLAAIGNH